LTHRVIEIYTDGSCNPTQKIGAWAAILFNSGEKIILKGTVQHTTHNRMELMAVITAIDFAIEKLKGELIVVFTDSQYVCRITERKDRLKKNSFITKKGSLLHNSDLLQLLIYQIETHSIQFVKVKAHQAAEINNEINYNSEVDKIVRQLMRVEVDN
jgi:ribonuclease HI